MIAAVDRFHGLLARAFPDCDGVKIGVRFADEGTYLAARVSRAGDSLYVETFGHTDGERAAADLGQLLTAGSDGAVADELERLAALAERQPLTPTALRALAAEKRSGVAVAKAPAPTPPRAPAGPTSLRECEADGLAAGRAAAVARAGDLRLAIDDQGEAEAIADFDSRHYDATLYQARWRGIPAEHRDVWEAAYALGARRAHTEIALAWREMLLLPEEYVSAEAA